MIRERQNKWIGHIIRRDSLLKTIIEGQLKGKKIEGRQRTMLMDWMMGNDYYGKLKTEHATGKSSAIGERNLSIDRESDEKEW